MERTEMTILLKQHFGGALTANLSELAKAIGWGKVKTRTFLEGVDYYKCGKERRFFIADVSKRFSEIRNAP